MSGDESPVSSRTRSQDIKSTPRRAEDDEGGASYLGGVGEDSRLTTPRTVESVSLSPFGGSGREKDAYFLRLGKECGLKGTELANYVLESLNKELRVDIEQREAEVRAKSEAAMMREQIKIKKEEAARRAKIEEEELKLKKEEAESKAKAEEKKAEAEEKKAEAEERRAQAEERKAQAEEDRLQLMKQAEEDRLQLMREAEEKKETAKEEKRNR